MIVMRVKYDKTGSDVIPNKGLWFALPSLVKVKEMELYYNDVNCVCMLVCVCMCVRLTYRHLQVD